MNALDACPWKDTDHASNPDAYCTWCDGFAAALQALRSLPVSERMDAMGYDCTSLTEDGFVVYEVVDRTNQYIYCRTCGGIGEDANACFWCSSCEGKGVLHLVHPLPFSLEGTEG